MGGSTSRSGDDYGYNREQIENIGQEINNQAALVADNIVSTIKNEIVAKVAVDWMARVAVECFEEYKEKVKAKEADVTAVFQTFSQKLGEAGARWADETHNDAPSMPAIETVLLDLDISEVQESDSNGDVFIKEGISTSVTGYIENAREMMKEYIAKLAAETDASLAFFGGGQSDAIREAAAAIGDEIDSMLNTLQTDLNDRISQYQSTSIDTATTNTSSFADSIGAE